MPLEIRTVGAEELDTFVAVLETAAGRHPNPETVAEGRSMYQPERTLAAFDGRTMVGGTASTPMELTVPGPAPGRAAKITLTGLLPAYRHRGIAGEFMRRQLQDLRDRGEHLAVLTTSVSGVPFRHGFGPATRSMAVEVAPTVVFVLEALERVLSSNLRTRPLGMALGLALRAARALARRQGMPG